MSNPFDLTFPKGFVWGAATSSYQIEGGWNADGKGLNVWDHFSHQPYKVKNGDTGDVACDHYHRWAEDVDLMAWLGLQSYRFSISWARILPDGFGRVNPAGLDFYERLVDRLLENGIRPNATLNHWDFPQALSEQGGWTNRAMSDWFTEYAGIVFEHLGDRVEYWATHNEPKVVSLMGYADGTFPPGRSSVSEAMLAVHHLHLAHAKAIQVFREGRHKGEIGIVIDIQNYQPKTDSEADRLAARRAAEFNNGLFTDPILLGKYPEYIVNWLGDLFPSMPAADLDLIHQPIDFLGMNYYMSHYVSHAHWGFLKADARMYSADGFGTNAMDWGIDPEGLLTGLRALREHYGNPKVFITENGTCSRDVADENGFVNDIARIRFLREHILKVHEAISEGSNIAGYYVWSLLDNFEWANGYEPRFGLVRVDFDTLKRTPKQSAHWYRRLIDSNTLTL